MRLQLMRRFDFRIGELINGGLYPANRQIAALHLRQLMYRALLASRGQVAPTVEILASGLSGPTQARLLARITTWIENLQSRLEAPENGNDGGFEQLQKDLIAEYRGFRGIGEVLTLLRERR